MRRHSLLVGGGAEQLRSELGPLERLSPLGEVLDVGVAHQTNLLPGLDDLAEAAVTHRAADEVLHVLEAVELLEDGRVAVGVADEVVRRGEVVRLGGAPKKRGRQRC